MRQRVFLFRRSNVLGHTTLVSHFSTGGSVRLPSRLHRNRHGVFGYRVLIPRSLRSVFAQPAFRVTLHTTNPVPAKKIAQHLNTYLNTFYARIQQMNPEKARMLGQLLIGDLTAERDRVSVEVVRVGQELADVDAVNAGLVSEIQAVVGTSEDYATQIRDPKLRSDSAAQEDIVRAHRELEEELLRVQARVFALAEREEEGLTAALLLRDDLQRLEHSQQHQAIVDAQIAAFEQRKNDMKDMIAAVAGAAHGASSKEHPTQGALLSTVIKDYRDMQIAECAWTPKSEIEIIAGLTLWLRIVGDQPISRYGHEQHRRYKATLQRLPANVNKLPKYRALSIDEILVLGDSAAALNTVRKQLNRVSALFNWAKRHGYVEQNPAAGMKMKTTVRASDERDPFTDGELQALFHSEEYLHGRHREPYMFWTPLLALYTGARQNEIAQLHLADFLEIDGIAVISINDEGAGKRVKTKAARRAIPVHAELIRLGLIDYVATLRERGETRLFPELRERRDGHGQTVSKWFRRYRERCGIDGSRKVFHSFRHTVIDRLKQTGHAKERIAALVGHEDDSMTFGRYGKPFESAIMKTVVQALTFEPVTAAIKSLAGNAAIALNATRGRR
jgi:integrase